VGVLRQGCLLHRIPSQVCSAHNLRLRAVCALPKFTAVGAIGACTRHEKSVVVSFGDDGDQQNCGDSIRSCRIFFQSGKVVSIERGGGLEQRTLSAVSKQLGEMGDWLHVFPEGRISYDGKLSNLRWGVGRMVCDTMKHSHGRYVPTASAQLDGQLMSYPSE
jgi:hypothetical protein